MTEGATIERTEELLQELPTTIGRAGSIPCQDRQFLVQLPDPGVHTGWAETGCAVPITGGFVAFDGLISIDGVDGRFYNWQGDLLKVVGIPYTGQAIVFEKTDNPLAGSRLHFYKDIRQSIRQELDARTQEHRFYLDTPSDWTLADKSGRELLVNPFSMSFSNNGSWMVVDAPRTAKLLVEVLTQTVVPFAPPDIYDPSNFPQQATAVSDDGKTAVAALYQGGFRVTDVGSCTSHVPAVITGPVACETSWDTTTLRGAIPGYERVVQVRFLENRKMSLLVNSYYANRNRLDRFTVAPPGEVAKSHQYLALGDSFTSGEGAYDYFSETDTKENKCHLSRQSYPYLIGKQLNVLSYDSIACSGARMQDITKFAQKQRVPAPNTMGAKLPGYQKQLDYITQLRPQKITFGIGGNDVGFISKMKACLAPGTCYQSYEDRLELVREINRQFTDLTTTYQQLKTETQSGVVFVLGYPQIAIANGDCAANVRLNSKEISLVNNLIDYLNGVIKQAADRAGARYTDVGYAFSGHRMCESDSQSVAMNGVTAGNDIGGVIGSESFHPNQLGHQLLKDAVLERTNGLARAMPIPDTTIMQPVESADLALLQAPKEDREVRDTFYDETMAPDVVFKNQLLRLRGSLGHILKPYSTYTVELHSDPIELGTFTTDGTGLAIADLVLPDTISAGFHTLHIFGTSSEDTPIDIYKTIYIAESAVDYDGDTVANTIDECQDQPDLGTDQDADGVDDVCDPDRTLSAEQESVGHADDIQADSTETSEQSALPKLSHEWLYSVLVISGVLLLVIITRKYHRKE
jgi:lysophospholipase L1-like esterase